jgi:hypothetical protein
MTIAKTEARPIGARLLAAQRAMKTPKLDSTNPHFRNRFASLGEVTRVAKEALNAEGLALTQEPEVIGTNLWVHTVIRSEDGENMDLGIVGGPTPDDPQKVGSALTYYRRYGLSAAFALVADEDDDAEAAAAPEMHVPATPKPSAPRLANEGQRRKVFASLREKGLNDAQLKAFARMVSGKEHSSEWTSADIDKLLTTDQTAFAEMDPVVGGAE